MAPDDPAPHEAIEEDLDDSGHPSPIPVPSRPEKRSFTISGHRTSISLEAAFWEALKNIAASQGRSLASIVAEIDRKRGKAGLSGAVRIWVLDYYRNRIHE